MNLNHHHNSAETTAPRVLLTETSRWPSTALLALDLAKAGSDVSAVCPTRHPILKTGILRQTFHYSSFRPLKSLSDAIEATHPDFIIPCDDRAVEHLHELHAWARGAGRLGDKIAALIEKSLGPPESYPIVSARYDLLRIAREEGLRVPDTEQINSESDLKFWQGRKQFPWVLKADCTFGGRGVKIAHTPRQAARFLLELTRYYGAGRAIKRLCVNRDPFWLRPWWNSARPAISVQSFIHGRPANCGVVCWNGKVLAGHRRRGGRRSGSDWPFRCGAGGGQPGDDALRGTDCGQAGPVWIHWIGFHDRRGEWFNLSHRNEPASHAGLPAPTREGTR